MAVSVIQVRPLNNLAAFTEPLAFEVEYEALTPLQEDLVWKLIYVGSADSDRYDQELESIEVGPVIAGTFKFVLEANPPIPEKIPVDDLVGVTVIMLTCSYRDKEFIRVGYYVNNDYQDEELRENPPDQPRIDRLQRSILDQPRVTRYAISFDDAEQFDVAQPMDQDADACLLPALSTGQPDAMVTPPISEAPMQEDFDVQQACPQTMYPYVPVQ